MKERKGESGQNMGPYNIPNDATALNNANATACATIKGYHGPIDIRKIGEPLEPPERKTEGISKLEPTTKEPTPQEIQRKIHTENLRNQLNNNRKAKPPWKPLGAPKLVPDPAETDPSIVAIVAAIEAGAPFVILLDDGKQVTMHASKLSQMTILGLMVKFVYQLKTQEINVKGLIDE